MNPTQGYTAATLFRQACTDFDFKDKHKIRTLITVLESTAQIAAQSELFRCISFLVLHTLDFTDIQTSGWGRSETMDRPAQALA